VLILGGGFGGVYAALELEKMLAGGLEVTLVTRENFFLFTPMLHEVAASDLEKKVRVALDWTLDLCFAKDFASVGET
jgi:NADH dehydrogenase FAD-containing subunit